MANELFPFLQKKANTKTGSEMQRDRDELAKKMREKQAAGEFAST